MSELLKEMLALKILSELSEKQENSENDMEYDEETSDFLISYEVKLLNILYILIKMERKYPNHAHPIVLLDLCTGINKLFTAHILHLFDEINIINVEDGCVLFNQKSDLAQALLHDEGVQSLFERNIEDSEDEEPNVDDLFNAILNDDTDDDIKTISLEDMFKTLGGI